ncbi:hypothetical protein [Ornithinibacillus sp. JPR2-1]|uniref:hypothetical protein n=2 Tax=Bacillaceae TaxID=186817 RepID=UPI0031E3AEC1
MIISTVIMGWIGILIFLIIIFTYQKLAKLNEYAFIHLLMALMYAMWLPLPFALNTLLQSDSLQVGSIFGFVYLMMIVITMTLQTGHISYIVKHNEDKSITEKQGQYMMATLSNPFELLANIFRCVWSLFLGIAFWSSGQVLMASLLLLFSLFVFYFFAIMLDTALVKRVTFFSKVKPNPILVNLETLLFFIVLVSYVTFHS